MNVETAVEKAKEEVVNVAEEAKAVAEKVTQELSSEEKLFIRETENTYLKAQIEVNRLSQVTQKAQEDFTKKVEELTRKYAVDPSLWLFDNVKLSFRRK
jgi:ABC-type nitrate/sulfonate/bicarbonate transport system substrate-binding protein